MASEASYRKGAMVWVEDRDIAWVEGELIDVRGKQVVVVTSQRKKVLKPKPLLGFSCFTVFFLQFLPSVF